MRKILLPLFGSLLIGGSAVAALVVNAQAGQSEIANAKKPIMLALMTADARAATLPANNAQPMPPPPGMPEAREGRRAEFCKDMIAHKAGELAFLESKLQLTSAQAPLFARWKAASMDVARRHEDTCVTRSKQDRADRRREDALARLDREADLLKLRLADIQAERPALGALYAALNAGQKEEFAQAQMRQMGGRMHMMMGMMDGRPGGHRPGRGGPDGEGPMPPPQ